MVLVVTSTPLHLTIAGELFSKVIHFKHGQLLDKYYYYTNDFITFVTVCHVYDESTPCSCANAPHDVQLTYYLYSILCLVLLLLFGCRSDLGTNPVCCKDQ